MAGPNKPLVQAKIPNIVSTAICRLIIPLSFVQIHPQRHLLKKAEPLIKLFACPVITIALELCLQFCKIVRQLVQHKSRCLLAVQSDYGSDELAAFKQKQLKTHDILQNEKPKNGDFQQIPQTAQLADLVRLRVYNGEIRPDLNRNRLFADLDIHFAVDVKPERTR